MTSSVWHHAAATYDATTGTWRLYLDGVLDRTLALGSAFQPQSGEHPARRARHRLTSTGAIANSGGFFQGVMDEVRIWNVARSTAPDPGRPHHTLTSGTGPDRPLRPRRGHRHHDLLERRRAPQGVLSNGPTWTAPAPLTSATNTPPVVDSVYDHPGRAAHQRPLTRGRHEPRRRQRRAHDGLPVVAQRHGHRRRDELDARPLDCRQRRQGRPDPRARNRRGRQRHQRARDLELR